MLCVKFPFPPRDGGNIAMLDMIRSFDHFGHDVTVLAMNTPKHFVDLKDVPDEWMERAHYYAVEANTSPSIPDALANLLFSKKSYHIRRFTLKSFSRQLEILLQYRQYDLIQLETLFMTPYLAMIRRLAPKAVVSLRAHNVEHEIWERRANNEPKRLWNAPKRFYLEKTAARLKAYEEAWIKNAEKNGLDALVPITDRDAKKFRDMKCSVPVKVCQVGVDEEELNEWEEKHLKEEAEDRIEMEYPSVFFIGSLDWMPNQEGVMWFLKKVWPKIHARYPKVNFYLAGRNMPREYRSLDYPNLRLMGEVEDAFAYMASKAIMVVPVLSGSGMRVKIIEGMAMGKAIVATNLAVEGIPVKHGQHLFLADEPAAFADCLSVLIEKRGTMEALGEHARAFVRETFDSNRIGADLLAFYTALVKEKNPEAFPQAETAEADSEEEATKPAEG